MILQLLDEAVRAGARLKEAVRVVGLSLRTVKRWRRAGGGEDRRDGPRSVSPHALTKAEQEAVLAVLSAPEHRDLPPEVVVAKLADQGRYVASARTMYRILHRHRLQVHRGRARRPQKRRPPHLVATGPNQVWAWDISYLLTDVRGKFLFLFLYVIEDVFSRKIVGWCVAEEESADVAQALFARVLAENPGVAPKLVVHSDNGVPMKTGTFVAFLQARGVSTSYGRPSVSDDNPHIEALFRTVKYCPAWPGLFVSRDEAETWMALFVGWYNNEHLHSGVGYVTPAQRHRGDDVAVLAKRRSVFEQAKRRNPARWSREIQVWERPAEVRIGRPVVAPGDINAPGGTAEAGSRVPEAAA